MSNFATIEQFIAAVQDTLHRWIDIHYDARTWAEHNTEHGLFEDQIKMHGLKCSVFGEETVDLFPALIKNVMLDNEYEVCVNCNELNDPGFGCLCEQDPDWLEEGEEPEHIEVKDLTEEQWTNFVWNQEDLHHEGTTILGEKVTEELYVRAMMEIAFPVYFRNVRYEHDVDSYAGDISFALEDMRMAEDGAELLAATMVATQIYHVHGSVIEDYGHPYECTSERVDEIRNKGYEEVFGKWEVDDFMYRPIEEIREDVAGERQCDHQYPISSLLPEEEYG